jgi:RNA polymerase sigma factor (sigma-70 family)
MQTFQKRPRAESALAKARLPLPEQPRAPHENRFSRRVKSIEELREFFAQNATEIRQKAELLCRSGAEDATQELFPKMVRFLHGNPNGIDNAWGIIHTMLARAAIDGYRTLKRSKSRVKRLEFPDSIPDHDRGRINHEDIEALRHALKALQPRLRLIVSGIFIDGCKAKDVAKRVGLSESRVAELKRVALEQLKEVLA